MEKLKSLRMMDGSLNYEAIVYHGTPDECHIMASTNVLRRDEEERIVVTTFMDVSEINLLKNALLAASHLGNPQRVKEYLQKISVSSEHLQGLRILVADDDTDICLNIYTMLSDIGIRSEWTASGRKAVIRAEYAYETEHEFAAYIIDWRMPDMNGVETVHRLRQVIGDSKPMMILTAYDWTDVEEKAREAGVTAFCEKPLFISELLNGWISDEAD